MIRCQNGASPSRLFGWSDFGCRKASKNLTARSPWPSGSGIGESSNTQRGCIVVIARRLRPLQAFARACGGRESQLRTEPCDDFDMFREHAGGRMGLRLLPLGLYKKSVLR